MASPDRSVVWFRRDLRLEDNPAWAEADGSVTTALWILEPRLWLGASPLRRAQLAAHLRALDASLRHRGGRLRVEVGAPEVVVLKVAGEVGARVVHANADVGPWARNRDGRVADSARQAGVHTTWHWGTLVHRPGSVPSSTGSVSRVFTPFYKRWAATALPGWPAGEPHAVTSEPGTAWAGIEAGDAPMAAGEHGAEQRLASFLERIDDYLDTRDLPSVPGTSALSVDLRFGTMAARHVAEAVGTASPARTGFVRQLAWRDWYAHLLWELPHLRHRAMRPELDAITWRNDPADIEAWKHGRTGYPLVDAGMRQLSTTGGMPNRVRMVCASFLVKDLLVDWRIGEQWFRYHLLDADVSQNVGNWQWCAGTGPDAAPYFRVFNPVLQSRRFDPHGTYVRQWVPELSALDDRWIHAPWEAGPLDLANAGVVLGEDYPEPIVDHPWAKERAMAAYGAALAADD